MGIESQSTQESAESLRSLLEEKKRSLRGFIDEIHDINSNAGRFQVDSIKLASGDPEQVRLKKYKEELKKSNQEYIDRLTAEIKEIESKLADIEN